jgi:hypothetical protein
MNYKLIKDKIILVESDFKIIGSNASDAPFFNVISEIDMSISDFENWKIFFYVFYNRIRNHINSLTIKNKINQLLNYKPKSSSNDRNKEALHCYWINL